MSKTVCGLTCLALSLVLAVSVGEREPCVLPVPDHTALSGHLPDLPLPTELSRTAATHYTQCTDRCCRDKKGLCNVVVFSSPASSSSDSPTCILYHCEQLVRCNVTALPAGQTFADTTFVRQLLTSSTGGEASEDTTESTPKSLKDSKLDEAVSKELGGKNSATATQPSDLDLSGDKAEKETNRTVEPSKSDLIVTTPNHTPANVTNNNTPGTLVTGNQESQSNSGGQNGTNSRPSASGEVQQSPETSAVATNNALEHLDVSSATAAGNNNVNSSDAQSSAGHSKTLAGDTFTKSVSANTTSVTTNDSDSGSSANSPSAVPLKGDGSGDSDRTYPESSIQTPPHGSGNDTSHSAPGERDGLAPLPGESIVTTRVTPAQSVEAQSDTNDTVAAAAAVGSKSSGKQHATTAPQDEGRHATSAVNSVTALSSQQHLASRINGTGLGTMERPDDDVRGDDVVMTTPSAEEASSADNATGVEDASLRQGQLSNGTKEGNGSAHGVFAPDSASTVAVLILALCLGSFFFLVALVLTGKRLVDCWRNRQYSQIRKDYLIDGMYDE